MGRRAGEGRSGREREGCLREPQARDGVAESPRHIYGMQLAMCSIVRLVRQRTSA